MSQKTLLFLAASSHQVPFIQRARECGYRIATCDNRPENPGHRLADVTANIDTTDKDGVLEFAEQQNVGGLLAAATDVALPAVAYACARLGLPAISEQAISILCDKAAFRAFQAKTGLPHPEFLPVDAETPGTQLAGRWIVKPVRSSGSKGVETVESEQVGAHRAHLAQQHSINGGALVERFLDGQQATMEGVISDGEVAAFLITDRYTAPHPHVATWGHRTPPLALSATARSAVIEQINLIARELNLDGPFDCDFVHDESAATILEFSPRAGGNHLAQLVSASTGFDWTGYVVAHAAGEKPGRPAPWSPRPAGVTLLGSATGGRLSFDAGAADALRSEPWVEHVALTHRPGDTTRPFTDGSGSIGHVVFTASDRSELDRHAALIEQRLAVTTS